MALLIGNQKYECSDLDKLKHTEEEVKRVAKKLRELNFKVSHLAALYYSYYCSESHLLSYSWYIHAKFIRCIFYKMVV